MSITTDTNEKPRLIEDVWKAILDDGWMWPVVWGKPRTGKSTVQAQVGFEVYKDWDQVLQSFVYNLAGLLYKMDHGVPCRISTRNGFHNRVPILLLDDWGAQGNKAKTQHEPAWDVFKGCFDTLGIKVAVLMASMGTPTALTQQLQEKYTHEIYVQDKGIAKYDVVRWQQNFRGWQPRQDKDWIETFEFAMMPNDVYKEYDENRVSLADELEQLVKDAMAESQALSTIRRMMPLDFEFLEIIHQKGGVSYDWIHKEENLKYKEALMRSKARSLAVPQRKNTALWYDITDFGLEVLQTYQAIESQKPDLLLRKREMEKPLPT